MKRRSILALFAGACASAPLVALAQGAVPKPSTGGVPVSVQHGRGEFAKKMNGVLLPAGKGWRHVMDRDRLLQILVPEKWKVEVPPAGDTVLRALPPGNDKNPKAVLMVILRGPSDTDPLEIDERFVENYAEGLKEEQPGLAGYKFTLTDSGLVVARGLKFALAGGTMVFDKKETFRQQQLVYASEDRIVSIQFSALDKEFDKYADDVAKIFASYDTVGVRKAD